MPLNGKKTYIMAAVLALASFATAMGWLTKDQYEVIAGLLGSMGLAALRAGVSKCDSEKSTDCKVETASVPTAATGPDPAPAPIIAPVPEPAAASASAAGPASAPAVVSASVSRAMPAHAPTPVAPAAASPPAAVTPASEPDAAAILRNLSKDQYEVITGLLGSLGLAALRSGVSQGDSQKMAECKEEPGTIFVAAPASAAAPGSAAAAAPAAAPAATVVTPVSMSDAEAIPI